VGYFGVSPRRKAKVRLQAAAVLANYPMVEHSRAAQSHHFSAFATAINAMYANMTRRRRLSWGPDKLPLPLWNGHVRLRGLASSP
jgi:hypothetical protein